MNPTTVNAQPGTPFIHVVREFDAPPERVFRASTDPELVARWLGPHGYEMRVIEYDARTGGAYRYVHIDTSGDEYGFRGVFHSVVANERIIQTFEYDGTPDVVSVDSSTYEDLGGRTRLSTHTVFPSVEARDTMLASGMERGVVESMERLDELLRQAAPASGRVVVDISMSLDGYVAAAGVDLEHGLGVGGEVIHDWAIGRRTPRDDEILGETYERTGAVVMGRRLFDIIDGPKGWSDSVGYGADHDRSERQPPVFVVTHSVPARTRLGDRFRFVTDGLNEHAGPGTGRRRPLAGRRDHGRGDPRVRVPGGGAGRRSDDPPRSGGAGRGDAAVPRGRLPAAGAAQLGVHRVRRAPDVPGDQRPRIPWRGLTR